MRCYNGAWDSEARAFFAARDKAASEALDDLGKLAPEIKVTWFPNGEFYAVFSQHRLLAEGPDKVTALRRAIEAVSGVAVAS